MKTHLGIAMVLAIIFPTPTPPPPDDYEVVEEVEACYQACHTDAECERCDRLFPEETE